MEISEELKDLARILGDWAKDRTLTIFLYGSRTRGDHRPDSDVDIHMKWSNCDIDRASTDWWGAENNDLFATINGKLSGPLQILEGADPLHYTIEAASVIYEDRNVKCVVLPPKGH
jgi:hypothetical protein